MAIEYPIEFTEFWFNYPRRIGKLSAHNAYKKIIKLGVTHAEIIYGLEKYNIVCKNRPTKYIKHPSTWLNGGCWEDEETPESSDKRNTFAEPTNYERALLAGIGANKDS